MTPAPAHTFEPLPGAALPAYRATGGMLPPGGVLVVKSPRGGWVATWKRCPGPRGTRHSFGDTREAAIAAVEAVDLARRTAAAAAAPPCPDCGQGWPDGCACDCPSRDE